MSNRSFNFLALIILCTVLASVQSFTWENDDDADASEIDPFDMGTYDPSAKYHKNVGRRLPKNEKSYVKLEDIDNFEDVIENNDHGKVYKTEEASMNNEKNNGEKEVVEEIIVKQIAWTVCSGSECVDDQTAGISEHNVRLKGGENDGGKIGAACLPPISIKDSQSSAKIYVRRIVKGLLDAMKIKSPENRYHFYYKMDVCSLSLEEIRGVLQVPLIAKITSKKLKQLEDFAAGDESDDSLNNVDSIMSELFERGDDCILDKKYCIEVDSWRNFVFSVKNFCVDMAIGNLDIWLAIMLVVAVVLVALFTSKRSPLYASLILLGVAFLGMSWYSHYQLMLQKSMAKRQADMARMANVPIECRPHEMQMHQMFWHWTKTNIFMADDPCDKYHEILLVDHTLEVTAIVALWDLVTTVVFHPLDHIGKKAGQFFFNFLGNLSLIKGLVVIVFMGIMSMFVLILLCGYQIRLPFWLGGIEPAVRRYEPPPPVRVEDIREEVTQKILESVTSGIAALQITNPNNPTAATLVRRRQTVVLHEEPFAETRFPPVVKARALPIPQNLVYQPSPDLIERDHVVYTRVVHPDGSSVFREVVYQQPPNMPIHQSGEIFHSGEVNVPDGAVDPSLPESGRTDLTVGLDLTFKPEIDIASNAKVQVIGAKDLTTKRPSGNDVDGAVAKTSVLESRDCIIDGASSSTTDPTADGITSLADVKKESVLVVKEVGLEVNNDLNDVSDQKYHFCKPTV